MTFQDLGLIDPILKALEEQGYETPSPIQEKAIGPALAGRDVLGCAQTGTGKTCAFSAPILQMLSARPCSGRPIRTLILTPTRELAIQIGENVQAYGRYLSLRSTVIFGGVGQAPQVDRLKRGVDILVATPGRLMDLHGQGHISLNHVEIFVLDEADRMLDMGFIHDVRKILKLLPEKKQTLFFSATMPPEITDLVNSLLKNPVKVAVDPVSSPVEVIDQSVYFVDKANKSRLLVTLIQDWNVKNALVFTRTKHGANKVATDLEKANIPSAAIHGNKSQTARQQALANFKNGTVRVLVATDIAARGLDIEELSHVFNYNLPEVPETYVHRIGRTGRAGRCGIAVAFCDFNETTYLKEIQRLIKKPIPVVENHPFPMSNFEVVGKDARGRTLNADDLEARTAARDRRRERDSANLASGAAARPKTASKLAPQGATAATMPPASPSCRAKGSKRGVRQQALEHTLPTVPTKANSHFSRSNPLSGDVVMDATARLLAPKPPQAAAQESSAAAKPQQTSHLSRQPKPIASSANAPRTQHRQAPLRPTGNVSKAKPNADNSASLRSKSHGSIQKRLGTLASSVPRTEMNRGSHKGQGRRRSSPMEVVLRPGGQKDSTEQPTLIKPYYISYDD